MLRGRLGRLLVGIGAFELGNVAATLLILRATELLDPGARARRAPPDRDPPLRRLQPRGDARERSRRPHRRPARASCSCSLLGAACFALAYAGSPSPAPSIAVLAVLFVLAGVGIGCVETAEHAAVAASPGPTLRGSAFGALAAIQGFGNFAASAIAGLLWTLGVAASRVPLPRRLEPSSLAAFAAARH